MSYRPTNTSQRYNIEPALRKVGGHVSNGRWNWWYSAIADEMIRYPNKTLGEIAVALHKHPSTLSMIINTDMFKEYFAQRKEAWRQDHDHALRAKLTDVATEGLDIVLEQLKAKRTQIPLNVALKVTESALDRLGYSPASSPTVVIDNSKHDNRQQTVQVAGLSANDLEEARAALRRVEHARAGTSLPLHDVDAGVEQGVELNVSDVEAQIDGVLDDPAS